MLRGNIDASNTELRQQHRRQTTIAEAFGCGVCITIEYYFGFVILSLSP